MLTFHIQQHANSNADGDAHRNRHPQSDGGPNPHVAGGRVAWRGHTVYVCDAASGETLARFVGEDKITRLAVTRDAQSKVVVDGDRRGRMYFLRWAGV